MAKYALPAVAVAIAISSAQAAFIGPPGIPGVVWGAGTNLGFGFNGLGSEKADADSDEKPEKKISAGGLVQLITAGMGAPFLGDYQGVDDVSEIVWLDFIGYAS
mmetsp:Transcript_34592/g.73693  ORF Transcript_34592/g.73693 Transcript_34592/m.73693 type:complete len:104 (-) Transcript_34592:290-601(-)